MSKRNARVNMYRIFKNKKNGFLKLIEILSVMDVDKVTQNIVLREVLKEIKKGISPLMLWRYNNNISFVKMSEMLKNESFNKNYTPKYLSAVFTGKHRPGRNLIKELEKLTNLDMFSILNIEDKRPSDGLRSKTW